jgi:hypothetical protein
MRIQTERILWSGGAGLSAFADRLLVQLSDAAQLVQLIAPTADATHTRLRTLLDASFTFESATIHDVQNVRILGKEIERPVFALRRTQGTWTRTQPGYDRTDVLHERSDFRSPVWVDLAAAIGLTLVLEVDRGEVASIIDREIANFTSLNDFSSRFQFIDLGAFMTELGVATFEELKERYRYLLAEFRLKAPPAFNPADPGNQRRFTFGLAVLIRDSLDVVAALREAKFARTIMERALTVQPLGDIADVRTPYAPLLLFPESTLAGSSFDANTLRQFFAAEGILALFVTPA